VKWLPPKPLAIPWCVWGLMGDIITHTQFQLNRFSGYFLYIAIMTLTTVSCHTVLSHCAFEDTEMLSTYRVRCLRAICLRLLSFLSKYCIHNKQTNKRTDETDGQKNKKTLWLRPFYTGGGMKVNCIVKAAINTLMCMKINFTDLTIYGRIKNHTATDRYTAMR